MTLSSSEYWSNAKETRLLQLGLPIDTTTQLSHEVTDPLYDQEIAALTNALCSLKSAKNAHRPIHKLPDEMLLEIFLVVDRGLMSLPTPAGDNAPRRVSMALACSQVCRRWRTLALSSKSLWSFVDFASSRPVWVAELLRRSSPANLAIRVVGSPDGLVYDTSFAELIPAIAPHCGRITSLELCINSAQLAKFAQYIPSCGQLAALQRLVFYPMWHHSASLEGQSILRSRLSSWLSDPMPQLREVSLSGWLAFNGNNALQAVLPVHLTYLHLENDITRVHANDYPQFCDLMSFLQRSTRLKNLILRNIIPHASAQRPVILEPIHLLELERLEIADQVDLCAYLLNAVHYPSTCSIAVEATGGEPSRYASLLPHIAVSQDRMRSLHLEQSERHELNVFTGRYIHMAWSPLPLPLHQDTREGIATRSWKFHWSDGHGSPSHLFRSLLNGLKLAYVTHLSLKGTIQLSAPDWLDLLSKPSAIEDLVIHSTKSGGYNLCVALGFSTPDPLESEVSTNILLPALSRLELRGCDLELKFRVYAPLHGLLLEAGDYRSLSWFLLRTMRARVAAAAVPQRLILTDCAGIEDSWVSEIKATVPEEMRDWDFDAWQRDAKPVPGALISHQLGIRSEGQAHIHVGDQ